jgi:hypothetical protein
MSSASSTISVISHGGTTFTLFPKLPPELRVKIWEYALPEGPRVIKVCSGYWQRKGVHVGYKIKIRAQGSFVATPLLLVSVEARTIAKQAYPFAFKTFPLKPVRVNFEKDILYFHSPSALKYFTRGDFASPKAKRGG